MDNLSPRQFHGVPVEGLGLSQSEAVSRFQNTRTVSVGGEVVKISNGLRNQARELRTREDVARWGSVERPGVKKPETVQAAAHRYGLVGPQDTLGRVLLQAYGRGER